MVPLPLMTAHMESWRDAGNDNFKIDRIVAHIIGAFSMFSPRVNFLNFSIHVMYMYISSLILKWT